MTEAEEEEGPRRRPRRRWVALALLLVVVVVLGALWSQRRQIATGFIDRELTKRGVEARYQIADLGFGRQRLENVVIGDPARPDLTADWIEVRLSYGLRAPRVTRITARGVQLFGRIAGGKLSLGQIDKLMPAPSGAPFRLPDVTVDLADAVMRLDTPAGQIGMAIAGQGKLSDGFRGHAVAVSRRLAFGECTSGRTVAALAISVDGRQPRVAGPVRSAGLDCGSTAQLSDPSLEVDARFASALDQWIGKAAVRSGLARSGANRVAGTQGNLSFAGDSQMTRGTVALAAANGSFGAVSAARLVFDGRYELSMARSQAMAVGDATAGTLTADGALLRSVTAPLRSFAGTPLEPFGAALAAALGEAGKGIDGRTRARIFVRPAGASVRIETLDAASRSGARLSLAGGQGITIDTASGTSRIDGRFALSGGGFPAIEAALTQPSPGGPISGTATMAPFVARGARLALAPIRFTASPDGMTRIETRATVDGPFSGGAVRGLVLPVSARFGRGAFTLGEGCMPLAFQALRYSSLQLGPTRLALCPIGRNLVWTDAKGGMQGGAEIRGMRLAGRLGSSPISYTTDRFRLDVGKRNFSSSNVAVRLGSGDSVNRLDLATLGGRFTARGIDGSFAGGSGEIANVPLLLSAGNGRWQVVDGSAIVDAALVVSDEADPSRFHPLRTDDLHLTLVDNRIDAAAWLTDPETGTRVTRATIAHDLGSSRGRADLDVPGIQFNDGYQPDQLTRLTVGVIALVKGELSGKGEILWGPDGATSSGTFSTTDMDLAAPFGPATGITATVHFNDLLGLATPPGQEATIDKIQAGIDVYDGRVRYQLLPGLKVRVQSGEWPYAGGRLALQETVLDFSQETQKHLVFRVDGLDAATFVQQMQFTNISATGTFDGVVPMMFDKSGGHIVDGNLIARPAGGVVSYVGELSDKQLGVYGKMAFDALKSLRYNKLTIQLDGSLDGEFLAGVELDGIALETPRPGGIAGYAIGQLAKIPFEFNITAKGRFRALIGMMRSLKDPIGLIQDHLPQQVAGQPIITTVQPQESETVQ